MTPDDFRTFADAHPGLRFVDALVFDLNGRPRGKRYPIEDAEKLFSAGMQLPVSTYYLDVTGACQDPCGRGYSDGDPDAVCRPVPGTLAAVPWTPVPAAQVLMSMRDATGGPNRFEPRNVAAAALERLRARGLEARVAFEVEFYLLESGRSAGASPRPATKPEDGPDPGTQVYAMAEIDRFESFFEALTLAASRQGIPASVTTAEYAPAQYEVNLRYRDDALVAADDCVLFKRAVQAVARRHGLAATFMAKPFVNITGSGMHVHLSLLDDAGCNVFASESDAPGPALTSAIAGLLATMPDAMALFAPSFNAFRRFQPGSFVPITRSWARNNRSVACRIPPGDAGSRRIEHRVAGADANPYLVLAALVAGVERGLEDRLAPGPEAAGAACKEADPGLPGDILDALDRLQSSAVMRDVLGGSYVDVYCATKRTEFAQLMTPITQLEHDWYL